MRWMVVESPVSSCQYIISQQLFKISCWLFRIVHAKLPIFAPISPFLSAPFVDRRYGTDKWGTIRTISSTAAIAAISLTLLPAFTAALFAGLALILVWMFTVFMNTPAVQAYFIQSAPQSANLVLSFNTSISHLWERRREVCWSISIPPFNTIRGGMFDFGRKYNRL
ncbi:hypothetical protein ABEV74_05660 [Paenibacillus cisolokensis]|uniref:hypothetical protein n=1 Tax=Paenibacillus cisolokensis TaxID=1658519 RepID=UPI003D29AAD7